MLKKEEKTKTFLLKLAQVIARREPAIKSRFPDPRHFSVHYHMLFNIVANRHGKWATWKELSKHKTPIRHGSNFPQGTGPCELLEWQQIRWPERRFRSQDSGIWSEPHVLRMTFWNFPPKICYFQTSFINDIYLKLAIFILKKAWFKMMAMSIALFMVQSHGCILSSNSSRWMH